MCMVVKGTWMLLYRDKKFGIENKFRPKESLGLIQWRNYLIAAYPLDALNEKAFPMPLWFDFELLE